MAMKEFQGWLNLTQSQWFFFFFLICICYHLMIKSWFFFFNNNRYAYIVVVINACPTEISFTSPVFRGKLLQLHSVQVSFGTLTYGSFKFDTFCKNNPSSCLSFSYDLWIRIKHHVWFYFIVQLVFGADDVNWQFSEELKLWSICRMLQGSFKDNCCVCWASEHSRVGVDF